MNNSSFFSLNWNDFFKGLLVAVGTVVLAGAYDAVKAHGMPSQADFQNILQGAVIAAIAYLKLKLVTNSEGTPFKKETPAAATEVGN